MSRVSTERMIREKIEISRVSPWRKKKKLTSKYVSRVSTSEEKKQKFEIRESSEYL